MPATEMSAPEFNRSTCTAACPFNNEVLMPIVGAASEIDLLETLDAGGRDSSGVGSIKE